MFSCKYLSPLITGLVLLNLTGVTRASIYQPRAVSSSRNLQRYCDRENCDPIVFKCKMNKKCDCRGNQSNVRCAYECIECLEEKFGKCCACVNLCPALQNDDSHYSHVGDINQNITDEDLFSVLTETDDIHGRWTVETSHDKLTMRHPEHGDEVELAYRTDSDNKVVLSDDDSLDKKKCILAFINKNLDMEHCKRYCTSMGASYYRWFHDNCCECVGRYCLNYGLDKSRCLNLFV